MPTPLQHINTIAPTSDLQAPCGYRGRILKRMVTLADKTSDERADYQRGWNDANMRRPRKDLPDGTAAYNTGYDEANEGRQKGIAS